MTETYAAALGLTVPELLMHLCRGETIAAENTRAVCNFKLPLLTDEQMESLFQFPSVRYVHQIHNTAAKQEREKGYCEVILSADSPENVMAELEKLASAFPALMENVFLQNARKLACDVFNLPQAQ